MARGRDGANSDAEQQALRAKFKVMPLEYLLTVLNDHRETPQRKMEAAKMAAPFLHPRLEKVYVFQQQRIPTLAAAWQRSRYWR